MNPYQYLVEIDPLGLLYASSGPFLSPENLVGLASQSFPPSANAFAGLMAHALSEEIKDEGDRQLALEQLYVAGPFWSFKKNPNNFCVPTPFCYLSKLDQQDDTTGIPMGNIQRAYWQPTDRGGTWLYRSVNENNEEEQKSPSGKFDTSTWFPIQDWDRPQKVYGNPYHYLPHLHPRLREDERRVWIEEERGSLFLENAVQLNPAVSLIYLSNTPVADGWYRFGGEGHLVEVRCHPLPAEIMERLDQPLGQCFATITPGVWGSNRFSRRYPMQWEDWPGEIQIWTERAVPYRFRLGNRDSPVKRLSRGRYAVPAGTIYQIPEALPAWQMWESYDHPPNISEKPDAAVLAKTYFPVEGYSFKHWGCGLALPIDLTEGAIAA